jgi:hypothetical protein
MAGYAGFLIDPRQNRPALCALVIHLQKPELALGLIERDDLDRIGGGLVTHEQTVAKPCSGSPVAGNGEDDAR